MGGINTQQWVSCPQAHQYAVVTPTKYQDPDSWANCVEGFIHVVKQTDRMYIVPIGAIVELVHLAEKNAASDRIHSVWLENSVSNKSNFQVRFQVWFHTDLDHCNWSYHTKNPASVKNMSIWVERLRQSGCARSEPSETRRWQITPGPARIPHVALHIALRLQFRHFVWLCQYPIVNEHSVTIRRYGSIGYISEM